MRRVLLLTLLALSLGPGRAFAAHPMFLVTPERRAVWKQMKADYDAKPAAPSTVGGTYYKMVKAHAECACKYSDNGIWGSLMYQMTQDPKYATLAWSKVNETFLTKPDNQLKGNFSREFFTAYVLYYDWLHTALTPAQRAQFLAKLNVMATNVVTNPWQPAFPIRSGDSDQMVGDYFGLAMLQVATAAYNPTIAAIWVRPYVGGFVASGTSGTFRNVVKAYVTRAKGGEWMESGAYNMGTTKLLVLGYEALRTGRGKDDFPEVAALIPELALRQIHMVTPDLTQAYQWGDEEHPREFRGRLFYRVETAMVLAGLAKKQPAGAYVQDLVLSLIEKYGATGHQSAEPWGRAFLVWDPYAPRERTASLGTSAWAAGMGQLLSRTGWRQDDRLFGAHFPAFEPTDHFPSYFGEFQLYRKGEWAITHPLGYMGPPLDGRATNSMTIGGFPYGTWTFREFKRVVAQESSPAFEYLAGTTAGQTVAPDSYNPPPTFLHEWTRSLVYLPGSTDVIVVHDRVNAEDPRKLGLSGYRPELQTMIQALPANKQWFVHAPEKPQIGSDGADWRTVTGQRVRLDALLPPNADMVAEDERLLWPKGSPGAGYVKDEEKKWRLRVTLSSEKKWTTFLNVLQAHDGFNGSVKLVRSAGGEAEGAFVERDTEDTLLLFNGIPAEDLTPSPGKYLPETQSKLAVAHWRKTGFSVKFQAGVRKVRAYVFDLVPSQAWSAQVDDGPPVALPVSSAGVGQLVIPAGGSRRLVVMPTGRGGGPTNTNRPNQP